MQFGLYLLKKGVISPEQFVAALEVQLESLVPIGQLALEENVLSPRDIFAVLQAQSHSPSVRFGDLAVDMGFMTRGHLMRLLMMQADRKQPLKEILIEQGAVTAERAASEAIAYRRSQPKPAPPTIPADTDLISRLHASTAQGSSEMVTV